MGNRALRAHKCGYRCHGAARCGARHRNGAVALSRDVVTAAGSAVILTGSSGPIVDNRSGPGRDIFRDGRCREATGGSAWRIRRTETRQDARKPEQIRL